MLNLAAECKRENVSNLIDWLMNEASLWSCIKRETIYHRSNSGIRSDNHANDSETSTDQKCPIGCEMRHLLSACPTYQKADVNRRWEIKKQNNRCRKCLRAHHTNICKKPDGTTCNRCTPCHHCSLVYQIDCGVHQSRPRKGTSLNALENDFFWKVCQEKGLHQNRWPWSTRAGRTRLHHRKYSTSLMPKSKTLLTRPSRTSSPTLSTKPKSPSPKVSLCLQKGRNLFS